MVSTRRGIHVLGDRTSNAPKLRDIKLPSIEKQGTKLLNSELNTENFQLSSVAEPENSTTEAEKWAKLVATVHRGRLDLTSPEVNLETKKNENLSSNDRAFAAYMDKLDAKRKAELQTRKVKRVKREEWKPPQVAIPAKTAGRQGTLHEKRNEQRRMKPPVNPGPRNEKTPGRVGPIKSIRYDLFPDIDLYKGPKDIRVRKSNAEIQAERTQFILDNPEDGFHHIYVCHKKGPDGSPTYDDAGFEMDYDKVAHWMAPTYERKGYMWDYFGGLEEQTRIRRRMAAIFFETKKAAPKHREVLLQNVYYWQDRVSKDLEIPFHKVGPKEFEIWGERGFPKAKKGEYQDPAQEEKERMEKLRHGANLRK